MNEAAVCIDERTIPGELMSMVAGGLHELGFHVVSPDDPDERTLTITNAPGTPPWRLSIHDSGDVEWEYPAPEDGNPNPKRIVDIVTALLTGETGPSELARRGCGSPSITLKGMVGLELRERGFNVELAVYRDDAYFDAQAEIIVSVAHAERESAVSVADDGAVTWTNDYWYECAVTQRLSGKEAVARDIVETVRRAVNS